MENPTIIPFTDDEILMEQSAITMLNYATAQNTQTLRPELTPTLTEAPAAFGLSKEFVEAEARAHRAGIIWTIQIDLQSREYFVVHR